MRSVVVETDINMGIVSSLFIHVVINVCWQCRLYMEGDPRSNPPAASPESGFLNTPDATSTPQSPVATAQITDLRVHIRRQPPRDRQPRPGSRNKSHRLSEILSPVEEEMIRITMARGYATPASRRSKTVLRNINRAPSRGNLPNVIQRFPEPSDQYLSLLSHCRTRGMRI